MIIAWAGVGVAAGLAFGTATHTTCPAITAARESSPGASPLRFRADLRCLESWETKISEPKRIRIDPVPTMNRAESMFAEALTAVRNRDWPAQRPATVGSPEPEEGWMSYWQPADRDRET